MTAKFRNIPVILLVYSFWHLEEIIGLYC